MFIFDGLSTNIKFPCALPSLFGSSSPTTEKYTGTPLSFTSGTYNSPWESIYNIQYRSSNQFRTRTEICKISKSIIILF